MNYKNIKRGGVEGGAEGSIPRPGKLKFIFDEPPLLIICDCIFDLIYLTNDARFYHFVIFYQSTGNKL